jgi:hypothetical protein
MESQKTEKFSLKDQLFHRENVTKLAREISVTYPDFQTQQFIDDIIRDFPLLELKERISHITNMLEKYLGTDFAITSKIIERSLPPPLDEYLDDDDF